MVDTDQVSQRLSEEGLPPLSSAEEAALAESNARLEADCPHFSLQFLFRQKGLGLAAENEATGQRFAVVTNDRGEGAIKTITHLLVDQIKDRTGQK